MNLRKVEFSTDSDLETIERCAFFGSAIERMIIPQKVSKIGDETFSYCQNLKVIEILEESKLKSFSSLACNLCPEAIIMVSPSLKKSIDTKLLHLSYLIIIIKNILCFF